MPLVDSVTTFCPVVNGPLTVADAGTVADTVTLSVAVLPLAEVTLPVTKFVDEAGKMTVAPLVKPKPGTVIVGDQVPAVSEGRDVEAAAAAAVTSVAEDCVDVPLFTETVQVPVP